MGEHSETVHGKLEHRLAYLEGRIETLSAVVHGDLERLRDDNKRLTGGTMGDICLPTWLFVFNVAVAATAAAVTANVLHYRRHRGS